MSEEAGLEARDPRAVAVVSQMGTAEQIDFARCWIQTICSAHIWRDSSGGEFHGKIVGDILSFGLDAAISRLDAVRAQAIEECARLISDQAYAAFSKRLVGEGLAAALRALKTPAGEDR